MHLGCMDHARRMTRRAQPRSQLRMLRVADNGAAAEDEAALCAALAEKEGERCEVEGTPAAPTAEEHGWGL